MLNEGMFLLHDGHKHYIHKRAGGSWCWTGDHGTEYVVSVNDYDPLPGLELYQDKKIEHSCSVCGERAPENLMYRITDYSAYHPDRIVTISYTCQRCLVTWWAPAIKVFESRGEFVVRVAPLKFYGYYCDESDCSRPATDVELSFIPAEPAPYLNGVSFEGRLHARLLCDRHVLTQRCIYAACGETTFIANESLTYHPIEDWLMEGTRWQNLKERN